MREHSPDAPTREPVAVRVRRVYDAPATEDGRRVLVDRLWPRGLSRERARLDEWAKEIAPSTELRRWFHAAPDERRAEFTHRYRAELATPEQRERLAALRTCGALTLLTAAREPSRSHAQVLADLLTTGD